MITFDSTFGYVLEDQDLYIDWINRYVRSRGFEIGELSYVFCEDHYLIDVNKEFLNHDNYTDIISFDHSLPGVISGELYISLDRVKENALQYEVSFKQELKRVMIHGVLHFFGEKDKTSNEALQMRLKEELAINMFHVEQDR